MTNRYVLVLDAGTSASRSYVFDRNGAIAGSSVFPWSYADSEDASPLARAFNPQGLWHTFCTLIAGTLKDAGLRASQIAAVAITSQRQAVVFLDAAGKELYAGPNLDLRAVFEGAAIDDDARDRVYRTTGHLPSFLFAPAKLRWFKQHRPEVYARIASILPLADWVAWRLTGNLASEVTLAGEAGLLDIRRRSWCITLLNDLGLISNSIPLVEAGSMAGTTSAVASGDTGLRAGTPVAVPAADTQCGLLGMGVAQEHQVGVVAGWSVPLQMVTRRPMLSSGGMTWTGCFLTGSTWVLESSAGDLGNAYAWLVRTFWGEGEETYQHAEAAAAGVSAGAEGALAFLGPARMNMTKLGMRPGGLLFPVPLTFSAVGRGHLARALLEAMAFAVRTNLEQIEKLSGARAADISLGGGMTRTKSFTRILTDVLGRDLRLSPTPQVSALGAYLSACVALGEYASLEEAALSRRPGLLTLQPDQQESAQYDDYYTRWLQLSSQLQGLIL